MQEDCVPTAQQVLWAVGPWLLREQLRWLHLPNQLVRAVRVHPMPGVRVRRYSRKVVVRRPQRQRHCPCQGAIRRAHARSIPTLIVCRFMSGMRG